MNVVGEILTKLFAIGIAGAGAFVAAAYILDERVAKRAKSSKVRTI